MRINSSDDVETVRQNLIVEVDILAEDARREIITSSPGQSMTYDAKYQEAKRYPNEGPFPFISGEAEALGVTEQSVVDSVLLARTYWENFGAHIEASRLKIKAQLRAANTVSELFVIRNGLSFK